MLKSSVAATLHTAAAGHAQQRLTFRVLVHGGSGAASLEPLVHLRCLLVGHVEDLGNLRHQ